MGTKRPLRALVVGAGVGGVSIARALLRDGHDVTVFEQRPEVRAGGGAVTIWSNGETVLRQLGVDMDGAGQQLSKVRVVTSTGRRLATLDLAAITARLGAPVSMVPRRMLLERLLESFPVERIRCNSRVSVVSTPDGVRLDFEDGSAVHGDVVVGADGLHSILREYVGAPPAEPTGWCSWQGLVTLPDIGDKNVATVVVGESGNLGLWPAGGDALQWWFDLPWSADFVRPHSPIGLIRSAFAGWSELADRVLETLTDDHLAHSPYPHFRHPVSREQGVGALTLVGDAAHTMPPTFAQGTNQALLDTMVLRKAVSDYGQGAHGDIPAALRWYEKTRRRQVAAVSRLASLQVAHNESVLKPAALIPDRVNTWALMMFLGAVSHRRIAAEIGRESAVPSDPWR
ncbi:FAD-dependent oxidoreductase [Mycolicibacterium sp. XJ870]